MKREIKFRAWHKEHKEMEYPNKEFKKDFDYWDGCKGTKLGMINSLLRNDDIVLMQFIGLKDRNEIDIYEGDILKEEISNIEDGDHSFRYYTVCFGEQNGRLQYYLKSFGVGVYIDNFRIREVCGNIHQNPELLKYLPKNFADE